MTAGTATWVPVGERLPEPYEDVPILLVENRRFVGRLNKAGCWELASRRWQYLAMDVTHWLEVKAPLP